MAKLGEAARKAPLRRGQAKRPSAAKRSPDVKDLVRRGSLIEALMDDSGVVVVDRLVDRLGMSKQQFGAMIGVSGETLQKKARAEAPKTQERVKEAVEIIDRVQGWAGGELQAAAWYKSQPIPAFGGRTAESLVKSGQAGALRDYLDHLALGGFA